MLIHPKFNDSSQTELITYQWLWAGPFVNRVALVFLPVGYLAGELAVAERVLCLCINDNPHRIEKGDFSPKRGRGGAPENAQKKRSSMGFRRCSLLRPLLATSGLYSRKEKG